MTFEAWLQTLSLDTREDLDIWSAQQGWNAAIDIIRSDEYPTAFNLGWEAAVYRLLQTLKHRINELSEEDNAVSELKKFIAELSK